MMTTNQKLDVETDCEVHGLRLISSFIDRVAAVVGSAVTVGIQSYEMAGGNVVACDIWGSDGSVSLTMFPNGKTGIPAAAEFTAGKLGGAANEVELEFSVADYAIASQVCQGLAMSLGLKRADLPSLQGAASLRPPSSWIWRSDRTQVDQAHTP